MDTQPDLIPPPPPSRLDLGLAHVTQALAGRRWVTAAGLRLLTGYGDRTLRAIAAHSGDRIISGQAGYGLIDNATPEEIRHAASWLISQGRKMLARGCNILAGAHRRLS